MTCLVHFEWREVGMLLLVTLSEYFLYLFYSLLLFYVTNTILTYIYVVIAGSGSGKSCV